MVVFIWMVWRMLSKKLYAACERCPMGMHSQAASLEGQAEVMICACSQMGCSPRP
jgi:hypothetical protein